MQKSLINPSYSLGSFINQPDHWHWCDSNLGQWLGFLQHAALISYVLDLLIISVIVIFRVCSVKDGSGVVDFASLLCRGLATLQSISSADKPVSSSKCLHNLNERVERSEILYTSIDTKKNLKRKATNREIKKEGQFTKVSYSIKYCT